MNRSRRLRSALARLLLVSLVAGLPGAAVDGATSGSIRVTLQPSQLLADGQSTATVVADVRDANGDRVPDGTPVRFTTTAGAIEAVVLTTSGIARAIFTAAAIPDTAQITVVAEDATATARLPMLSQLPDVKEGRTIVRVDGRYVAYDEQRRILEAVDDATLRYRGVTVTARRLQLDLNTDTLRADGDVRVEGRAPKGQKAEPAPETDETAPPIPLPGEERGTRTDGAAATPGTEVAAGSDAATDASPAPSVDGEGDHEGEGESEPEPAPERPLPPAPSPERGGGEGSPSTVPPSPERGGGSGGRGPLTGDRLILHLRQVEGVILSRDGEIAFSGPELRERPAPAKTPGLLQPLPDLSESDMLWTAQGALVFLGSRIQLRGATPYWVGARLLPLGYQEIPLDGSAMGTDRYVGVGSDGLVADLPYYLSMGAGGSTSLRLRHGDRSGFGYFAQNPGWQLDLERKYGAPGGVEGLFTVNRLTSDWGLRWTHNQPLGATARMHAFFDYPAHRDLYGQLNLNKQWRFGSATLSLAGNKMEDRALGHAVNFGMESRPRALGAGFTLAMEGRVQDSRGGEYVRLNGRRFQVPGITQQELGVRLRPPLVRLGPSSSITSSFSLRQAWGHQPGLGVVGAVNLMQKLGGSSSLSLNYNYNQTPGYSYLQASGKQNLSASLFFRPDDRFRLTAFGMMGLDNPMRSLTGNAAFLITPSWRLDLLHTHYGYHFYNSSDTQIGIARALGNRELFLYWSTERHQITIEVGINQF
jgi:hypothetical protein